ncbi:hypothetical protein ACF9IK_00445 [Kitasatospora hibisci]|uniref:hypothetical protein n=1 Tax=Kitasatospora hibisci TaxID=3369522 RepID=UPI00375473EC
MWARGAGWGRRRNVRLAELAYTLELFGAEPVEDPGAGEPARTAEARAADYRTGGRGPAVHRTGGLLEQAAAAPNTADHFRGALIPAVNHHLRCAATILARARTCLQTQPSPTTDAGAVPLAGDPDRGSARAEPWSIKASSRQ